MRRPSPGSIIASNPPEIALAGELLRAGEIVGMPTETVYGLAGDATNGLAVAAIYDAKGRPSFNPLISHLADPADADAFGVMNADAARLAAAFWPGPLTLVVPHRAGSPISDLARAGLDTVALRVPSHPVARALIRAAGRPIAAPSANRSGRISPTEAIHVQAELDGKVAVVVDGGPCEIGLESTVVACINDRPMLLRPGGVPREALRQALGRDLADGDSHGAIRGPGMLESHYAPIAPLQMNVAEPGPDDAVLTFASSKFVGRGPGGPVIDLSPTGDLRQAAARLFGALRELDAFHPSVISVTPIPMHGLGEAINDRLRRAAAPRSDARSD
ncbi:MAG: L-threonylcarbamoyladenylate synthase [Beijerinckiaceae bacterium]